jgi:predicted MFS family arabinose efflux permease
VASTVTTPPRPGYRRLLRTPHAWSFLLPGFAARQPFAMLTIGIVLLVQDTTGSYGSAGAVAAATGAATAFFAPRSGRLTDRFGQAAVLVPGVLAHAASVALLTGLALGRAPLWALLLAALPTGASVPQVGPMVRARWACCLNGSSGGLPATAAAFESVTDEFTFVLGPVLATALCTSVRPAAGLAAEAALTLAGGLLFAAQRRTQPPTGTAAGTPRGGRSGPDERGAASALRVPGVRVLAVAFLGIGSVFGGMQVSLAAFTREAGHPGLNGLLYGVFAAGNMLSGAVCGALSWRSRPRTRMLVGYTTLTLFTGTLWAVASAPLMGAAGLLTGLCVAPALVNGYTLVESLVPPAVRTESFTWLTGAVALGQAAAVTVAGRLADAHGASAGFVVPLAGTAAALLTVTALRRHLDPAPGEEGEHRGIGHPLPAPVD